MDLAAWKRQMDANLNGVFYALQASQPLLAENAHLVITGAIQERLRLPGFAAYAAAKTGLEAFAEAYAKEDRKRRVTVVRPGAVATPFWEKVPLSIPKHSLTSEQVAGAILQAYETGHKGLLDLSA